MAAPSITNRSGSTAWFQRFAWLNSPGEFDDAPAQSGLIPGSPGLCTPTRSATDTLASVRYSSISPQTYANNSLYSNLVPLDTASSAGVDLSAEHSSVIGAIDFTRMVGAQTIANGGCRLALLSGSPLDGYAIYDLGGSNLVGYAPPARGRWIAFGIAHGAQTREESNYNPANIRSTEGIILTNATGSNPSLAIESFYYFQIPCFINGEVSNPATLTLLYNSIAYTAGDADATLAIEKVGTSLFFSYLPIQIGRTGQNVYWNMEGVTLEFAPANTTINNLSNFPENHLGMIVILGSTSYFNVKDAVVLCGIKQKLDFTGNASASIVADGFTFVNGGFVSLDQYWAQSGGAFKECDQLRLNGASLNGVTIGSSTDPLASVLLSTAASIEECVFELADNAGCAITQLGDFSSQTATIRNNTNYDVVFDLQWADGRFYGLNSLVYDANASSPGWYKCTSAGLASGADVDDDSGCSWTARTTEPLSADISGFVFPVSSTTPTNIRRNDEGSSDDITVTVARSGLDKSSAATGDIILIAPIIALTAENFADDIRLYTARYQTFIVNSADINAATDEITLGTDNETSAAFAGQITTPATLAYLVAAPGATLPATTPQINTANLYYVAANSSGVIQISETEGGAAIAFSDTGTESGGYLFSLTCTTQLSNEIISGGNGFSASYALPDGALIEVAAQGIAADESTATTLFHRIVEWSSTGGASIADTFSLANNPDLIYNQLIGEPLTSDRGIQVTVTNTPSEVAGISFDVSGNIELDANAITDATLNAPDAYLWSIYQRYTADGIRYIRNQFSALSVMQYVFNGLTIDNIADGIRNSPATPLVVYGNLYPATGTNIFASATGTIRVEPFFVTDITSAGDGSFTSSDRAQLLTLYNTTTAGTGATVFSEAALANAPSGGGGGDATAANQTLILNAIADVPTNAELEARTLLAAEYFDPDADSVDVGSIGGQTALASSSVDFDQLAIITDGVPTSNTAVSSTVTFGTVVAGTVASTQADDGNYYSINPTAGGLDLYLEFQIGSNFPNAITFNGKYNAQTNRFANVYAYDWIVGAWELISSDQTRLNHSTTDINRSYPLLSKHRNGAGSVGEVRIRFTSTDTNTGYQLDIDQVLLQSVSAAVTAAEVAEATRQRTIENTYRKDYGISIDTISGEAGTVIGQNGIPQNPSSNIADAYTLSQQERILSNTFYVNSGSVLTLDRTYENWNFVGEPSLWTANLNGQTLTGTAITSARINGTGVSTGNRIRFDSCILFNCTLGNSIYEDTVLVNTVTLENGSDHSFRDCFGKENSTINFNNPTVATRVEVLDYQGYLAIRNMNSNCTCIVVGAGILNIDSSSTGGTLIKSGDFSYTGTGATFDVEIDATIDEVIEALDEQGYTSALAGNLVQTTNLPANFDQLDITTEGYISRVVANTDMRGTDGALLADSYMAPDNTAIADIKTKTDQLTFTVANQVDANALTGGGGDDAETIFTYFSGQGYTATRAGYLDKLNLPGVLTQTSDLPTNFADLAIAETTGLVSIGSLPTIPTNWLTAAGIAADAIAEIQSGLSTLTEAGVRSAVGLLTANLDTQLAAIGTNIDAVLADTGTSIPNTLATLQTGVNDLPDEVAAQSAIAQLISQVDRVHLIHGLEIGTPLVVSETARNVGSLTQTISTVDDITTVTRTA